MNIPSNYNGKGKYLELWSQYISVINFFVKKGQGTIQLKEDEFNACGDRANFKFKMTIKNGRVNNNLSNSAVARDLKAILEDNATFCKETAGKIVEISMKSSFNLTVRVE